MFVFNIIIILFSGLCFGSFISMASHRFADEKISVKDFVFRNSFCPNCNNGLKIKHLFPLFSWLFFRGKCGFCQVKISIRYPLIETFTALLFLGIFFSLGTKVDLQLILMLLIAVTLIIMIVVDLEHYFIPDFTQFILFILAIVYHLSIPSKHGIGYYFLSSVGFVIFGLILRYGFYFVTKKEGIGIDDIKFLAPAGLLLGFDNALIFMTLSGIFGMIFGPLWMRLKKDDTFPFAPSITTALLFCLIFKIDYIEWLGLILYLFEKHVLGTAY
ncbi:MAG: leader peptidase (prepilin peptidase)/N-methyltransferase [Myxococcota bacterium]|jgi:leader peptidase (prepilin peptidase)/N-methyltransferase